MFGRRDFLKLAGVGVVSAVVGGCGTRGVAIGTAKRRLNVLFVAVDDLRPQIGCYGVKDIITPNLDRLAAGGTVFMRAYCQQAVCSPSRTSLMTGTRPDTTRVYDLETHFRDTIPDVVTLSEYFKQQGYAAEGMGKIYHGGLNDDQSWSRWHNVSGAGYVLQENIRLIKEKRTAGKKKGLTGKRLSRASRGPATEMADVADDDYRDGQTTNKALEVLGNLKEKGEPFFLAVGYLKPHLPFNCPKKYWDMYDPAKIKLADNPFGPKGSPDFALTNWGELRRYHQIPEKGPLPNDQARQLIHGYYACVSYIDTQIGRLLDGLEKLGLADHTAVVVWGDHGWQLGEHGLWCKHTNFETSVHSPLIVRSPGQKRPGGKSDGLVEFVDIYPTLCELCGLKLPGHLEGRSFAALLDKPNLQWKEAAFSQYPRSLRGVGRVMGYSMRTDRYRYTEWRTQGGEVHARELYDHEHDPQENVNLAVHGEYASLVEKLSRQLRRSGV